MEINASKKTSVDQTLDLLDKNITDYQRLKPVPFEEFLNILNAKPSHILRNIFQAFHDMIKCYVDESEDTISRDVDKLTFTNYDCSRLFVEDSENPYFTDMLFANRFMKQMEYLRHGAQQNRIYIFYGPHGCGKSTFLNNLLKKFEMYANTEEGLRYEIVWRLDIKKLQDKDKSLSISAFEKLIQYVEKGEDTGSKRDSNEKIFIPKNADYIEVPCISHDNPFLAIPKEQRRIVLDELIKNDEFKWRLFTEKEYEWVFKEEVCTICSSIYHSLLERLGNPSEVFKMLYARPYYFNRRLGNGISVFNPGDRPLKMNTLSNEMLQNRINSLFQDSNVINYLYSRFAKINNGIYALMDIKSHNIDRMVELHNIISEGLHKVEDIEERVDSLFFALMNPEDKRSIRDFPSFEDRIQYIDIPYVLDVKTEVKIYNNIFGRHIEGSFLPMVLDNFARIIICTRIGKKSLALAEWIKDPLKYKNFCDEQLMLLKMELFSGNIPKWLKEDDIKSLDNKMLKKIIAESEIYGKEGLSGRDSIKIFDRFYSKYAKEDRLINMPDLCTFFNKLNDQVKRMIPHQFLESLLRMYDYSVLQQVKESLYYYNEEQIAKDIKNYISAVTNEFDSVVKCIFTKEEIHVTEAFLESIENRLLSEDMDKKRRQEIRNDVLKEYTTRTLTQEIMIEGKNITETRLFESLYDRYVHNLKKRVLEPFIENENFRNAIKDFDTDKYKAHDKRIKKDVKFLLDNMSRKFGYSTKGANEACIYVIDNDLANKFK
ncbi:serine protein kinase PrkA [Desulfobacula toluolica]|uniref:Putative serine protein kinase, related to PrkA n=1 Tax=Desulfobacula toluolica (strain DSM 7467 / Tol2) TaxID=651182 RepID=K0NP11_DESTT|nr:serine protein kinase PrkA [Desulfobacula toluolica]CCK80507.1 putative serine protein kinase, related to PrkA [Desulfobacula toluolica Tol2]